MNRYCNDVSLQFMTLNLLDHGNLSNHPIFVLIFYFIQDYLVDLVDRLDCS